MNVDDIPDEDEEEAGSEHADDSTETGVHKAARTGNERADGDSIPKWSNPEMYTALPPPEELRPGKKIDFVQLIRKAKNEAAEKSDATNAVVANDDFISFGDDDATADDDLTADDLAEQRLFEEGMNNKRPNNGGYTQGSLNDLDYSESAANPRRQSYQTADIPGHEILPVNQGKGKGKRSAPGTAAVNIVDEWLPTSRCDTAPWLDPRHNYAHLVNDRSKWYAIHMIDDLIDRLTLSGYTMRFSTSTISSLPSRTNTAYATNLYSEYSKRLAHTDSCMTLARFYALVHSLQVCTCPPRIWI